ncbi:unnamed protein product [Coffea canephora]|uniref:Uncharacterized protein n=1 Tax=Coffea canephora TaxID=49390 RepID=A0A068UJG5_COFCA|nr:unnamed protein product [Coffea canephora]
MQSSNYPTGCCLVVCKMCWKNIGRDESREKERHYSFFFFFFRLRDQRKSRGSFFFLVCFCFLSLCQGENRECAELRE